MAQETGSLFRCRKSDSTLNEGSHQADRCVLDEHLGPHSWFVSIGRAVVRDLEDLSLLVPPLARAFEDGKPTPLRAGGPRQIGTEQEVRVAADTDPKHDGRFIRIQRRNVFERLGGNSVEDGLPKLAQAPSHVLGGRRQPDCAHAGFVPSLPQQLVDGRKCWLPSFLNDLPDFPKFAHAGARDHRGRFDQVHPCDEIGGCE